jgi:hypothetical protein
MSGDSENWSSTDSGCRLTEPKNKVITCELLPDQEIPLLKSRRERSRAEALKLWAEKRKAGWRPCSPIGDRHHHPIGSTPHQAEL